MTRVLLVEDEQPVAAFIARGLGEEGHQVTLATNGREAMERLAGGGFDVVVLDIMLPGMDGRELCRRLRALGDATPVLMLTALDAVEDKVDGLNLGADDYLTKPFAFEELVACVAALARRGPLIQPPRCLVAGDLVLDRDQLVVRRGGRPVDLTAREMALLELLMGAPGELFGRTRILARVWGLNEEPHTNIVEVYIRRLRRKLALPGRPAPITTLRGRGYRLDAEAGSDAAG